ncbi:MAG: 30S ribosomal protein S2 [Parcubacteria group bacterium]|nr:30S ribosomal protein S2 [Parcubacteria group bacterium]
MPNDITKDITQVSDESLNVEAADPKTVEILKEMISAGVLYGHKKSKTHPRMRPFIFATRNGIEFFDLNATLEAMEKAKEAVKNKIKAGATILFVATQAEAKEAVEELAKKFGFPRVVNRWLGGTMTNFKTLSKRIDYMKKLRIDKESGQLEKYTKKERVVLSRELDKLSLIFTGLETMAKIPDMVVIVNVVKHSTALREAKRLKIPVIAVVNSDVNPESVEYPVPGNDVSRSGISWFLRNLESAIEEGKKEAAASAGQTAGAAEQSVAVRPAVNG